MGSTVGQTGNGNNGFMNLHWLRMGDETNIHVRTAARYWIFLLTVLSLLSTLLYTSREQLNQPKTPDNSSKLIFPRNNVDVMHPKTGNRYGIEIYWNYSGELFVYRQTQKRIVYCWRISEPSYLAVQHLFFRNFIVELHGLGEYHKLFLQHLCYSRLIVMTKIS